MLYTDTFRDYDSVRIGLHTVSETFHAKLFARPSAVARTRTWIDHAGLSPFLAYIQAFLFFLVLFLSRDNQASRFRFVTIVMIIRQQQAFCGLMARTPGICQRKDREIKYQH